MPRPLILKVDDYKPQPNKKAMGSISVQILKENSRSPYETYNFEDFNVNNINDQYDASADISLYGTSMVRSLINKYESSTVRSNLTKSKSKSLADLPRPQMTPIVTKTTQDDFLYNKNIYDSENPKFDFKRIFSKFESPNYLQKRIGTNYPRNENLNLSDIKQRAKSLLENSRYEPSYSLWQYQVIELLQQIENLDSPQVISSDLNLNKKDDRTLSLEKKEKYILKDQEFDSDRAVKVRDIKNIFEEKTDSKRSFSRANSSSYSAYFGIADDGDDINKEHRQIKSSISIEQLRYFNGDSHRNEISNETNVDKYNMEEISYDVPDEVDQTLQSESAGKVDELRNFFESEPGKYALHEDILKNEENKPENDTIYSKENIHVVDNRMLPPPKICVIDKEINSEDIETTLNRIKELKDLLEAYERKINDLSDKNKEDGSYINEDLVRILIELDEITTYGDKDILMERRNAIQFVQNCIYKLKDKNVLQHEKENFETRFNNFKEKIAICEGVIKTYQQKINENEEIDTEARDENLQLELEDVKLKLKKEEIKNKELEQDVDDLNALINLYVREAEKRDHLEEEWREKITKKLRLRIISLEEEMFGKIGEIHNHENTIIELRCELCKKDEDIASLTEKLSGYCNVKK